MLALVTLGVLALQGLVRANPLIQSVHSCPSNYQQNLYQHPYTDRQFVLQASNINPYLQQLLVQNPLPTYQLQTTVKDNINQVYWDKLLSNPTLRTILQPNPVVYNQNNNNELQRISQNPFNSGGVVNNYIIVPPEYVNLNKTSESCDDRSGKTNNIKSSHNGVNVVNQKEGINRKNQVTSKHTGSNLVKTNKNERQPETKTGMLKPDNDKDISNIVKQKKKITPRKGVVEEKANEGQKVPKSLNYKLGSKTKVDSQCKRQKKSKKLRKNASKTEDLDVNKGNRKSRGHKKKTSKRKKNDRKLTIQEDASNCDCVDEDEILKIIQTTSDNLNKMDDVRNKKCTHGIDDWLDINQDYVDLEKRRTRNSKNEATLTDFRNMYPDLPDDISKSFTKYINDLMANPQASNSNLFYPNNMYPFDFSQIYQTPQYSATEGTKSNANRSRKKKNKRRKKQKSKKNTKNKKREKESGKEVTDARKEEEAEVKVAPTIAKNEPEVSNTSIIISTTEKPTTVAENATTEGYISEEDIESFEEADTDETPTEVKIESVETTTSKLVVSTTKTTTAVTENVPEPYVSEEVGLGSFDESAILPEVLKDEEDHLSLNDKEASIEKQKEDIFEMEEVYETQIPDTVHVHQNGKLFGSYYGAPELGLEDEVPNIFVNGIFNDYYPDFTADNHAYLLSQEEFDLINVHDRYFYTTDKNYDSGEVKHDKHINSDYSLEDKDDVEKGDFENGKSQDYYPEKVVDKYTSDEVVFRTPPGLDAPDFRTKQINKDRYDSTEIVYQHSNYDDKYDRFNFDNMADRSDAVPNIAGYIYEKPEKAQSLVETVYARSKVVKYGQSQDFDKDLLPSHSDKDDRIQYGDVDKTIVIAKTVGPTDTW